MVNQLLTELDGFSKEDRSDIFVIAATNHLDQIDPAVIRPGRVDRKVEIGLPDRNDRFSIIDHYFSWREPKIVGIDINWLASATDGWSTAELKTLVNEARMIATSNKASNVQRYDIESALAAMNKSKNGPTNPPIK